MFLIPYHRIEIQSAFGVDQAMARISQAVQEESVRRNVFIDPNKYFRGSISHDGFRLYPTDKRRNAYIPSIAGSFSAGGTGTIVTVTFSGVFHLMWFCLVLVLWFLTAYSRDGNLSRAAILAMLALLVFHAYSYYFGFLPEVRQSESLLRDLLGDYR